MDELDAAFQRLVVLERDSPIKKRAARQQTGTAEFVRRFYREICAWQSAGRTWQEIVVMMDKVAVPIAGLTAVRLRAAVSRERLRRDRKRPTRAEPAPISDLGRELSPPVTPPPGGMDLRRPVVATLGEMKPLGKRETPR